MEEWSLTGRKKRGRPQRLWRNDGRIHAEERTARRRLGEQTRIENLVKGWQVATAV